jgi:hypothetical protein
VPYYLRTPPLSGSDREMKTEGRFTDKLPPAHPSSHSATVRGFLQRLPCFTVLGRSLLLVILEVAANVICWAIAARSRSFLSLAILAWVCMQMEFPGDRSCACNNRLSLRPLA